MVWVVWDVCRAGWPRGAGDVDVDPAGLGPGLALDQGERNYASCYTYIVIVLDEVKDNLLCHQIYT